MKKLFKRLLLDFGYEIRRKTQVVEEGASRDTECDRMIQMVRGNSMVPRAGLESLYCQARYCEMNDLRGDYVECGVWKGGAVALLALVNMTHGKRRRDIHLFDSFQDICEPDPNVDGERAIQEAGKWGAVYAPKGRLSPLKGFYDHCGGPGTVEENRLLLEEKIGYDRHCIHYHPGWFQDVIPRVHGGIREIAILRIDADWYASTRVCLEYLFRKVTHGGFVIIDDYGAYDGCRKAVDEFLSSLGKPLFLNMVNADIRYLIVP